MSKPPEDEDTFFQILDQIKQALTQSDVVESEDAEIMQELEQGIRHSLEALMGMNGMDEPNITVVEGGASNQEKSSKDEVAEASPEKTNRPNLTLLPSVEQPESMDDGGWDLSNVQVRVVSGDSLFKQFGTSKKTPKGSISLKKDDSQVILRSEEKHLYRVMCIKGELKLQSHFEELFLKEGQSLDVESSQIVVLALEDSTGQYHKI